MKAVLEDIADQRDELKNINETLQKHREAADLNRLNVIKPQIELEQAFLSQRFKVTQSATSRFSENIYCFSFYSKDLVGDNCDDEDEDES